MAPGYRLVFFSPSMYNEVNVADGAGSVRVGTTAGCVGRFSKSISKSKEDFRLLVTKKNDGWNVRCEYGAFIKKEASYLPEAIAKQGKSISICAKSDKSELFKMACFVNYGDALNQYDGRVPLSGETQLVVGNTSDEDINVRLLDIKGPTECFTLKTAPNGLSLSPRDSHLGIYVNGTRGVGTQQIKNGDFFSCGPYSFYYSSSGPDRYLFFTKFDRVQINGFPNVEKILESKSALEYPKFNRSTRVREAISNEPIPVLDPPDIPQRPSDSLLMTLIPAIAMLVLVIVLRGVLDSSGGTYAIFSICSMALGIVTSIFNYRKTQKTYAESLKNREDTYNSYISRKEKEISRAREVELESLNRIYPGAWETLQRVDTFSGELFDRTPTDEDFLHIRLGVGKREAVRRISYKARESLTLGDELQKKPENISQKYRYLEEAPIVVDLKKTGVLGIVGEKEGTDNLLRVIIEDVCTRQFSKDVALFAVGTKEQIAAHKWIRYIPHFQKEDGLIRNIACDKESCDRQFEYLFKILSFRKNNQRVPATPAVVVFVLNPMGLFTHPVSHYLETAKNLGVFFVFVSQVQEELPLYCGSIVKAEAGMDNRGKATLVDTTNGLESKFVFDRLTCEEMEKMALKLAPVYCEDVSVEGSLPGNLSLFALLGIRGADDLDLAARWRRSDITKSMAAPLGVKSDGKVMFLDLHEKYHGPHGLVAGTTGSGKSELLQTYILSMATLYPPDEVGFVIIDFKGDSMAGRFKNLPHLIGTITDIDGKTINRSLMSIRAELDKRKRLFAKAKVSSITDYIRKYKKKSPDAAQPLPHLILIIDEFGELKDKYPDFMKEVKSTARVGRSLGIHLILATQKPAGVVDDQIWSNSRFKICLKVQSQSDSNEVLKSPLAAEIKEPGRAYLQVGNNEIFELFQSAYSGESSQSEEMDHVTPFKLFEVDQCGRRTLKYSREVSNVQEKADRITQLNAIVNLIGQYCKEAGVQRVDPICLPALPKEVDFQSWNSEKNNVEALIGIIDDPENQRQEKYAIDVSSQNTLILGSAQLGKTNLLQVIIRSLTERYSPEKLNLYIIDFNSMFLRNFAELPHVGGVICVSDEEKIRNFIKLIYSEMAMRKGLLNSKGVSNFRSYCEAGNKDCPQIVILVDNFTGLRETYFADDDPFLGICRDGLPLGISVIIANAQTAGFGYRYLSTISNRIALFCNDKDEFINLFGYSRQTPSEIAGRAIVQQDKKLYEVQIFLAFSGEREVERTENIRAFVHQVRDKYPNISAKKIPEVPEQLTVPMLYRSYPEIDCHNSMAFAIDYESIEPVVLSLQSQFILALIGKKAEAKRNILDTMLADIEAHYSDRKVEVRFIDTVTKRYKGLEGKSYVQNYTTSPAEILTFISGLGENLAKRSEAVERDGEQCLAEYPTTMIIVNNRKAIDVLSGSRVHMEIYDNISKNLRDLKSIIIFSDVDNATAPIGSGDILRRIRDEKKAFYVGQLSDSKLIDVPYSATKRQNIPLGKNDAFYFDGDAGAPLRVKIASASNGQEKEG